MKDKSRVRVLFVCPMLAPFARNDLDMLRKHFEVRLLNLEGRRRSLGDLFRVAFHMLRGVLWADVTYAWFAENYAEWMIRLGKTFSTPSIVVVGGYEVAKLPEISYGSLLNGKKEKSVRYVLAKARVVLPVDASLKEEAIKNLGIGGENMRPLATGHDPERFRPAGAKERMALTVGVTSRTNIRRKGLDTFVQAAKHLKDVEFVLVGDSKDGGFELLKKTATPNVRFPGFVSYDELVPYYQRAKVYCQLSMYEGLPNALCEAMLCECVPVGTPVAGIPGAIGSTGFIVPVGDPKAAAEAISKALESNSGGAARARIVETYSAERRERTLVELIMKLGA